MEKVNFLAYNRQTDEKEVIDGVEQGHISRPDILVGVNPRTYNSVKIQKAHRDLALELAAKGVTDKDFISAGVYDIKNKEICEWYSDTVPTGMNYFLPKQKITELLIQRFETGKKEDKQNGDTHNVSRLGM
ncbi:MAG: hypothetical protein LBQ05_00900 [Christensenellaceae bacterium]|jgi:hypothetical protein|nr:hypothetical protein [Christensenellaceae bacterium]